VIDEDRRVEGWYRRRLYLTPGMTGDWQVFGAARIPLREMVTIDYLYVSNWSLWADIKILLRTIPCVVGRRGQ
jgi:lipopolysaccharide/colanic/teichoic acid biosynthesis glycosyltransferase